MRCRCSIKLTFEPGDHTMSGRGVGVRRGRRWHCSGADLTDNFLPSRGVGGNVRKIECIERQSASFQSLVMTGDTVLIEGFPIGRWLCREDGKRKQKGKDQAGHFCAWYCSSLLITSCRSDHCRPPILRPLMNRVGVPRKPSARPSAIVWLTSASVAFVSMQRPS